MNERQKGKEWSRSRLLMIRQSEVVERNVNKLKPDPRPWEINP